MTDKCFYVFFCQNKKKTRTAWAVFKYCGTKTAPLRRIFFDLNKV
jgi:hypothetical protein